MFSATLKGERMDDIKAEFVDELLKSYERPKDIIGEMAFYGASRRRC